MVVRAAPGTARELLVVLALAATGLLLALIAVFAPWYDGTAEPRRPTVLEMRAPVPEPPVGEPVSTGS
ncbi:hypothetical protein O7627_28445 [Solwaraspora sp. WMMD1047]|uniref:hypothetical protein n=1 Tax=Solwaraspora sp. WMMD1047 TaxID=3016102 RepID=UPI002415CEBA|nr:hypothetical protein [Solwaraspora sp. WMMD1047]MDG4833205.1 hypothetical protein [Solwaraspora sp. WMMD1047]